MIRGCTGPKEVALPGVIPADPRLWPDSQVIFSWREGSPFAARGHLENRAMTRDTPVWTGRLRILIENADHAILIQ